MITRTTWGKGERAPRAKLRAEQVRAIVRQLEKGFPHDVIADCYDVSRVAITDINRGATWSHVTGRKNACRRRR